MLSELQRAVERSDEQQLRRLFNRILPEASIVVDGDSHTPPDEIISDNGKILPGTPKLGLVEK